MNADADYMANDKHRTPLASEVVVRNLAGEVLRIEPPKKAISTASSEIARALAIERRYTNSSR